MNLLIIEDDKDLCELLERGLKKYDYNCDLAYDGKEGLYKVDINEYDAVILDINLPQIDGIAVCRTIRKKSIDIPILMLTARTDTDDKVLGLDSGADDYLGKPFEFKELRARLHALIRRNYNKTSNIITMGNLYVDTKSKIVKMNEKLIKLTAREYDILELLSYSYPNIISSEEIIEHVWADDSKQFSNVVRVHITNLRRKLRESNGKSLIETLKGKGYRICLK
ncbi:response regulator transcription factor [Clostridium sp. P21]|uniref:Stage 0 sporulation protein A homolog n=1 Tax=Clostridium muellerianum TaxID=2716538 RepID=A0A7Y0HNQ2_9CLOT|nr:response regulator transcription factor [Clostridium muellerianum]NMM63405.1 response regulator transcription factor [Clostridium muellerianum]